MKKLLLQIFACLAFHSAFSQTITARVVDSADNKPLQYAIVLYNSQTSVAYTDINGFFSLKRNAFQFKDSVIIQFLGYKSLGISGKDIKNNAVFKMQQVAEILKPVIVSNCPNVKEYIINKHVGRIRQFIGPGPETKFVVIAKYDGRLQKDGYISKVEIYLGEPPTEFKVPVRLRWYEWDSVKNQPGHELTDTNILVYPFTQGWNAFIIPARTIFCSNGIIVFGLEFIYPTEYEQQYEKLVTSEEKIRWLSDLKNRWSLGLQPAATESERSFFIINNYALNESRKLSTGNYQRPAIKFTMVACR